MHHQLTLTFRSSFSTLVATVLMAVPALCGATVEDKPATAEAKTLDVHELPSVLFSNPSSDASLDEAWIAPGGNALALSAVFDASARGVTRSRQGADGDAARRGHAAATKMASEKGSQLRTHSTRAARLLTSPLTMVIVLAALALVGLGMQDRACSRRSAPRA